MVESEHLYSSPFEGTPHRFSAEEKTAFKKNILVLSNHDELTLIERQLKYYGHEVTKCHSIEEAKDKLNTGTFDTFICQDFAELNASDSQAEEAKIKYKATKSLIQEFMDESADRKCANVVVYGALANRMNNEIDAQAREAVSRRNSIPDGFHFAIGKDFTIEDSPALQRLFIIDKAPATEIPNGNTIASNNAATSLSVKLYNI